MKWIARTVSVRKAALLVALVAVCVSGVATAESAKRGKAQKTSGVVWAGVTHQEGDTLFVSGDFKDKVLGRGAIVYLTKVQGGTQPGSILIKARKITIYTKRGSLSGKGEAVEHLTGPEADTVSDGKFKLDKGTGAYKGHQFKGKFDGVYSDGIYTFDYNAKYR